MNQLIRKSAPLASLAWKQTSMIPALFVSLEEALISESAKHSSHFGGKVRHFSSEKLGLFGFGRRGFHFATKPLEFRASLVSQAQFAVDDFSDEEKKVSSGGGSAASEEGLAIAKLGIDHEIVSALAKKGITNLFPIQRAVLEPAMEGRDMIGRARTGTGKTLAFGIPILDKIIKFNAKHGRGQNPLAIVLAPTRELAKQVEKEFHESAPNLDTLCVYGGVPISNQIRTLTYGVDVVVGTPGRIIDLIKRGSLNLSEIQFVVLDEADQMLQVGFAEDVEVILEKLPLKRQSMMFSATMPTWIKQLTQKYLKNPLTVDLVGDSTQKLADGITLYSIASDTYGKSSIVGPLITEHAKGGKCIVFTQTKRDADRLSYAMQRSFNCQALHGDISQAQRERTLSGFRDGTFNILVATDVAARGLDVPNVDLIIHYELPNNSEIFVHRTGRTGRAGKKGNAIVIYSEQQRRAIQMIERDVGCKFSELPKIAVPAGAQGMFGDDMGGRRSDSGFRSGGFSGNSGYGRSGFGGSSSGRSGGYGGSSSYGGSGSYGGPSTYGGSSSGGRSGGGFGSSSSGGRSGGGFGGSTSSGRSGSGGFGDFGRSSGSERSSGFGNFGSDSFGKSGSKGGW